MMRHDQCLSLVVAVIFLLIAWNLHAHVGKTDGDNKSDDPYSSCRWSSESDPHNIGRTSIPYQMYVAHRHERNNTKVKSILIQLQRQYGVLHKEIYAIPLSNFSHGEAEAALKVLHTGENFEKHAHLFEPVPSMKNLTLLNAVVAAVRTWNRTALSALDFIQHAVEAQYTHHSLAIESIDASPELITALLSKSEHEIVFSPLRASLILGHHEAFELCQKHIFLSRRAFSLADLADIHARVLGFTTATGFRRHNVFVGGSSSVFPQYEEVPALMNGFLHWYHNLQCGNPIECAATVHYYFIRIHPFHDGNGRVARLLMNLELQRGGFTLANIEFCDKLVYAGVLEHITEHRDFEPFYDLIGRRTLSFLEFHHKQNELGVYEKLNARHL